MDHSVADEYKSSLSDLNFNSKPLINMLTMLADENKKNAGTIVKTIIDHINSAPADSKLPGLYLVDSIMKNLGEEYMKIFCQQIMGLFTSVFEKVDENTRSLMFKLRQTWTDILPNKTLYTLDVSVKKLDPAWPVTAKHPSKRILINPKFIDGSAEKEEKKTSQGPADSSTSLKKEEYQIKQKQGEVLKQLLAKQEQLRQLEMQKLQLSIKKKNTAVGPNVPATCSFKKNLRDPRMVKINNTQNVSPTKTSSIYVVQEKPVASKLEVFPKKNNSNTPIAKSVTSSTKAHVQTNSVSITNIVEQCAKSNDHHPIQQKKASPKNKNEKHAMNKNKEVPPPPFSSVHKKVNEEVKYSNESTAHTHTSTNKTDKPIFLKNDNSVKLLEKNLKEYSKASKTSPKKKNTSDNNKMHILSLASNALNDIAKKKVSQMKEKIPKKTEKQKSPVKSESSNDDNKKIVSKNEKEQITSFTDKSENSEIKCKNSKLSDIVNKPKSIKTNDSQEVASDLSAIAKKDEDLRVQHTPPLSLNETATTSGRVPKRDMVEANSLPSEIDKLHPPRKKIKSDDAENCNPDESRSEAPILFGTEDQDLRHVPFKTDVNSKDWSQYKANHPDEYSPTITPIKQENYDGRYRSRKFHFPNKYFYQPFDYDRYGSPRPSKGKFSRRNRKHFHRGIKGQFPYNSPIASVMLDSHTYLQQAEEKFRAGEITETEFIDLRRDLQQMAESSEYELLKNCFPHKQEVEHHVRMPEKNEIPEQHDHEPKTMEPINIRIQKSSVNPPSEKTFFLDGKERVLHFIDDKAIVIMDNNEPYELTFKDEQKDIYVDGMAEPLTLGFDGKSIDFEVDGRRHAIKFGLPGRELYINNHPFEAQFGGPPVAAMLDDGYVYKIHLAGPAPQVALGSEPVYELFAKCHKVAHTSNLENSLMECDAPSSSTSKEDVDMRVKPNPVVQHDILLNEDSPFYCKDMKDVDWRQIPPSSNLKETEKQTPCILNENAASSFETWINEDSLNRNTSFQVTNNEVKQSVRKEHVTYEWNICEEKPVSTLMQQQNRKCPTPPLLQQRPHSPEKLSQQRHHPPEHLDLERQQLTEHLDIQRQQHNREELGRHPPEHIFQEQRQHLSDNISLQEQRQHPQEHIQEQRQHPQDHIPEERQYPPDHVFLKQAGRKPSPEHVQRYQYPSIQNMQQAQQQQQPPPIHIQQQHPPSVHMQQGHTQQFLHSENLLNGSTQKWTPKQDNYWQSDSVRYRKSYHSSYLEESKAYQPTQASSNQHFFEGESRYEPHPHPSYVPYGQRSSFQGRHPRGRYQHPRYRPPPFNSDFGRHRQNASLLDQPRPRFPAEVKTRPLLPPPPLPPPFLSSTNVPVRASAEIQNKKIALLPTPSTSSVIPSAEPSTPKMQVDIESLLEKLVAAGIINTKMYEETETEPEPESTDTDLKTDKDAEAEETVPEIEKIELTAESLRINRLSVISALHKGLACSSCGMRFNEMHNEQYSRHLDWHFRMNRREKDSKRAISRTWYYEIEDWIQFEEFEDFEERTPSYFELQAEDTQPEAVEVPAVILSVPATNDDQESCPVCLEKFQLFWVDHEEEWHFRNALRHDNVTYHPACYEDFKKTSETEKALKDLENIDDTSEIEEEIIDVLNNIIEDVNKTPKLNDIVPCQTDLPNVMEDVKVPPAEFHSEEEILEGKPGEEEIIGLISESDVEIDSDCPKAESKMVVMQSGGITLKVKAESLQSHSPSNSSEKDTKVDNEKRLEDEEEIEFRPPTPDPNFEMQPPVSKGHELSGLCSIM